ncbi:MAG: glycosyltransferase family 9 protein [Ignavibacteriaceae bacterium]
MIVGNKILIVRTDRIGDVVLSLPLARSIKRAFPHSEITFLLRDYTKRLALGNPYIDKVLTLLEKKTSPLLRRNIRILSKEKYDTCIVVYPTFHVALILFLSGIRNRIGSGYRWYSFLFTHKIYEHRKDAKKHELEYNFNLLKILGITETPTEGTVDFNLSQDPAGETKIYSIFAQNSIDLAKKIVIIHPGSGGSSIDLPFEKYRELLKEISKLNIEIFLTGNSGEFDYCQSVASGFKILNLAGQLDLGGLISLVSRCSVFISNSTGPLHIAAALGKFSVGFYPRIPACSQKRWGPYTDKKAIFEPEIDCHDCSREQCERLNCMSSIDISKVFKVIEERLKI